MTDLTGRKERRYEILLFLEFAKNNDILMKSLAHARHLTRVWLLQYFSLSACSMLWVVEPAGVSTTL